MAQKSMLKFVGQAALIFAAIMLHSWIKYRVWPVERGFFCGDSSIRMPYRDSTIDILWVIIFGSILTAFMVGLTELVYRGAPKVPPRDQYVLFGVTIPPQFVRCMELAVMHTLGLVINTYVLFVVKRSMGQLRPHFLDVCKPNVNLATCQPFEYFSITNQNCTAPFDLEKFHDMRLSFFSGHSSMAFYYATFLILQVYTQWRLASCTPTSCTSIYPTLYAVFFTLATIVCISRIYDNKHHPSDVVFGIGFGALLALGVLYCSRNLLDEERVGDVGSPEKAPSSIVIRDKFAPAPVSTSTSTSAVGKIDSAH